MEMTHGCLTEPGDLENLVSNSMVSDGSFKEILFDIGDGILLVDPSFQVREANIKASEVYGLPLKDLIGIDCRILVKESDRHRLTKAIQTTPPHGNHVLGLVGIRGDQRVFPMSVVVKPVRYPHQTMCCLVIRDNTEIADLKEMLKQEKSERRELYITLRNLMKAFENEKKGLEGGISHKIETVLLPAIEKVRTEPDTEIRNSYLYIMREQLLHLTKGFSRELEGRFLKLTRSEIRICQLIQEGHSTKEIADIMNVSFETVQVHRRNIREKLGLRGRKVNLHNLLSSRPLFRVNSL